MELHYLYWVTGIGILIALVILLLGNLLLRSRIRIVEVETLVSDVNQQLASAKDQQTQLVSELTTLRNHFKNNVLLDPLTALPTPHVFEDRLVQILRQSERHKLTFAVLFLAIDDFKVINGILGFESGDVLLKDVVERIKPCVRKVDTICRFGDDCIAFLLPQLTKGEAAAYVAKRLLDAIALPFYISSQELFITASVGISIYPGDGTEAEQLLKNADIALQHARARGPNTYQFYHEEFYIISHRELVLNSCLRDDAVYKEFILDYQPIINVITQQIVAMEALLRWQHPELGLVAPYDFVRLAENNGRIVAIGQWVLRKACEQFQKWQSENLPIQSVAVNVSLRQLENSSFSHHVSRILQDLKMSPSHLILEISENVLLPKLDLVEKTLHMLKHLGVQIAIDDFGTGFLSLQHLHRFPVTSLKIDTSLVQDMFLSFESEAIVKTIIMLATSLQLHSIAEGVESEKQKEHLTNLGCKIMQGYLFSRPRPPDEFTIDLLNEIVRGTKSVN